MSKHDYTQEELKARQESLPEDLRRAVKSIDMMKELRQIVIDKKLHIDQAGALADIVELTLSGILRVREFIAILSEALPGLKKDYNQKRQPQK